MASMVFISHSHADRELAEALVEFLLASLEIAPNNVRCTSVPGHQLAFGRTIAEQLKADINTSSAVMVLLTKTSMGSKWVMFELGASWALGKVVVPILGTSLTIDILPGPLSAYPSVATDSPEASSLVADAIAQIGLQLGLKERTGGKRDYKLQIFLEVARRDKSTRPPPDAAMAMAFEIPWLILLILSRNAKHPAAVYPQIDFYISQLGVTAKKPIDTYIKMDDEGQGAMDLLAELGGALAVRHPKLIAVYEGGANLMQQAARGSVNEFRNSVNRMPLPEQLKEPRDDLLSWLNEIHQYFVQVIHPNSSSE